MFFIITASKGFDVKMVYSNKTITVANAIKDCRINSSLLYYKLYADHLLMLLHDNLKEAFMVRKLNRIFQERLTMDRGHLDPRTTWA